MTTISIRSLDVRFEHLVEARVSRRNRSRVLVMIPGWTPHRPKSPKLADRFEPSTSRRSVGASLRSRRATSRRPIRRSTRRALFDARPAAAGSIRRVSGASSATSIEGRPPEAPPPAFPPPCPMLRSPRATTRHRAPGGVRHFGRNTAFPGARNRRFAPQHLGSRSMIFG